MDLPVIPVVNGVLPRPDGGEVKGIFLDPVTARLLQRLGGRSLVLLLPYVQDNERLYPAGVAVRTGKMWAQEVYILEPQRKVTALFAQVQGMGRYRSSSFRLESGMLVAEDAKALDLRELRAGGYPCIEGGGWHALEGQTLMKGHDDLPVTVHGVDYEDGSSVEVQANLGGLLSPEHAHTVEHGIIRSLNQYGLCTPRTLAAAISAETTELRASVEVGYRLRAPEIFGVTSTGACGNPMANLAQFHLAREVVRGIESGQSFLESVEAAKSRALSKLTEDLELTTNSGLRVLQGLKKGMLHDDSRLDPPSLVRVLQRFPPSPWE
ncbi:MAG: hypothetical protein AB1445_09145 [Bacillota bacterium]